MIITDVPSLASAAGLDECDGWEANSHGSVRRQEGRPLVDGCGQCVVGRDTGKVGSGGLKDGYFI